METEYQWEAWETSCWRGYYSTWEIRDSKLYLINFKGGMKNYEMVGIEYLFPNKKEVFAYWFNEEIRIPQGKRLVQLRNSVESIHVEDLFLKFKDGKIIGSRIADNRETTRKYIEDLEKKDEEDQPIKKQGIWRKLFSK